MRKFVTLLLAAGLLVAPLSQSFAGEGFYFFYKHHHHHAKSTTANGGSNVGPWIVGCGVVSAGSLIVGSEIMANDPDANKRRELTPTEAAWYASACPLMLPLAGIAQLTCPDNKATYQIARLALLYINKHPGASEAAFTEAYTEACQTGKLARGTLRTLRGLI